MLDEFERLMGRLIKAKEYFESNKNVSEKIKQELYKLCDKIDEIYSQLECKDKDVAVFTLLLALE